LLLDIIDGRARNQRRNLLKLTDGRARLLHYVTLCSNYLIGARHRGRLLKISECAAQGPLDAEPLTGRTTSVPETGVT